MNFFGIILLQIPRGQNLRLQGILQVESLGNATQGYIRLAKGKGFDRPKEMAKVRATSDESK